MRDGDGWKLVQVSKSNSTLLNGRPVKTEWYLQNGDEIQLSVNGPKLGFIVPTDKKSTVGSIGLTRRMNLFRQQALRPYKTAITALCIALLLAVAEGETLGDGAAIGCIEQHAKLPGIAKGAKLQAPTTGGTIVGALFFTAAWPEAGLMRLTLRAVGVRQAGADGEDGQGSWTAFCPFADSAAQVAQELVPVEQPAGTTAGGKKKKKKKD